jgi:hypothetical protein
MINITDINCRESKHIFCLSENCADCEIIWQNMVQPDRPQMKIQRMRFACWKTEDTNTHSEQVILISFPRQQWLRQRTSVLRYTCMASLVLSGHRVIFPWRVRSGYSEFCVTLVVDCTFFSQLSYYSIAGKVPPNRYGIITVLRVLAGTVIRVF